MWIDHIRNAAIVLSVLVALIAGVILIMGPESLPVGDQDSALAPVDFATLSRPEGEESYLACPIGVCPEAGPDATSPVVNMDAGELQQRLLELVDRSPDISIDYMSPRTRQFRFLVRGPDMLAPDVVSVRVFDLEGGAGIAVYSRTPVGNADRQRHAARVTRWLAVLAGVSG